jgi:hypothetical protein
MEADIADNIDPWTTAAADLRHIVRIIAGKLCRHRCLSRFLTSGHQTPAKAAVMTGDGGFRF